MISYIYFQYRLNGLQLHEKFDHEWDELGRHRCNEKRNLKTQKCTQLTTIVNIKLQ